MRDAQSPKICSIFMILKSRNVQEKYLATIACNIYVVPCSLSCFSG